MKTITIEIDNEIEGKLVGLSNETGEEISVVAAKVLSQGLLEKDRRATSLQALDEIFSQPIPSPFDRMTEDDVMAMVNEEIQAVRQAQ